MNGNLGVLRARGKTANVDVVRCTVLDFASFSDESICEGITSGTSSGFESKVKLPTEILCLFSGTTTYSGSVPIPSHLKVQTVAVLRYLILDNIAAIRFQVNNAISFAVFID